MIRRILLLRIFSVNFTSLLVISLFISAIGFAIPSQLALAASNAQDSASIDPAIDANVTRSVDRADQTDKKDKNRFSASLLSAPSNGIGAWVLQLRNRNTITVKVDAQTQLIDGIPMLGSLLDVRAKTDKDGALVASRIRIKKHEPSQLILRIADGASTSAVASRYRLTPLNSELAADHLYLFTLVDGEADEEEIAALMRNDPEIAWAELNAVSQTPEANPNKTWLWAGLDPASYLIQDAFRQINFRPSLKTTDGAGITVAVLDTGVALDHPALLSHLIAGWDVIEYDSLPYDEGPGFGWGHGTHIAGIIARMAPASKIMPIRVLDADGRGNIFTLALGIEWAIYHDADVINLSLGAEQGSLALDLAIQHAAERGVIVVASAGNNNTSVIQYPAGYKDVIAVTAVDRTNIKASFANFGPWVDLAAPGVGVTSTIVSEQGLGYASWSGTSVSAAFVSGAAALVRQQVPDASIAKITSQLKDSGSNLNPSNPAYKGLLGRLLNVNRTLTSLKIVASAVRYKHLYE